jgi:hypothetical protein
MPNNSSWGDMVDNDERPHGVNYVLLSIIKRRGVEEFFQPDRTDLEICSELSKFRWTNIINEDPMNLR